MKNYVGHPRKLTYNTVCCSIRRKIICRLSLNVHPLWIVICNHVSWIVKHPTQQILNREYCQWISRNSFNKYISISNEKCNNLKIIQHTPMKVHCENGFNHIRVENQMPQHMLDSQICRRVTKLTSENHKWQMRRSWLWRLNLISLVAHLVMKIFMKLSHIQQFKSYTSTMLKHHYNVIFVRSTKVNPYCRTLWCIKIPLW